MNLYDPQKRVKDVLKAVDLNSVESISRNIKFYETCETRKDDPFLPTYRLTLQILKQRLLDLQLPLSQRPQDE